MRPINVTFVWCSPLKTRMQVELLLRQMEIPSKPKMRSEESVRFFFAVCQIKKHLSFSLFHSHCYRHLNPCTRQFALAPVILILYSGDEVSAQSFTLFMSSPFLLIWTRAILDASNSLSTDAQRKLYGVSIERQLVSLLFQKVKLPSARYLKFISVFYDEIKKKEEAQPKICTTFSLSFYFLAIPKMMRA